MRWPRLLSLTPGYLSPLRNLNTLQRHQWLIHCCRMSTKQQPEWLEPKASAEEPVLKVYNSLTHSKTPFIPTKGRNIKWYNCGPTVYDASHMGHARSYVTQDIIRRILVDYFGYDVHFVMNITDIDDKIILRARQTHLLQTLVSETTSLTPALLDQVHSSWTSYFHAKLSKGLPDDLKLVAGQEGTLWEKIVQLHDQDSSWRAACIAKDEKFEMHLTALRGAHRALKIASIRLSSTDDSEKSSKEAAHELIAASRDILALALDAQHGHSITDPSIPKSLASFWEAEFMKDMNRLRVRPPDTLTRVTEYVPEIVEFVEKIVERGYAYVHEGSVYFDTRAFDNGQGRTSSGEQAGWRHVYAKLEPWSKGNQRLVEEGEGALSQSSTRYAADFALWKASKPGEPSWPSPWGPGRPGWHIECSVMASDILGDHMDIHSGGIDLTFPHHDNELAQSEAYHDCRQWVNYFLHTGHLHIEGLKMSKSLKNFITIDQILQKYTARQIRLALLLALWNAKIDFQESTMTGEVRTIETTFDNFFTIVKALSAQAAADGSYRSVHKAAERELTDALATAQLTFRSALCDSFNTPQALDILLKLVSTANIYITQGQTKANVSVLQNIARWVGKMLRMFGLGEGPHIEGALGWGDGTAKEEHAGVDREEVLMPYLRAFSAFRDSVRSLAMTQAPSKQILEFCDKFRDVDLVPLGVALDDQEDGRALVKLVPSATLMRLREEKLAAAEAKRAKKAAAIEAEREKRRVKMEKGKTPPEEMFKPPHTPEGVYGSWDDKGFPLTDAEGIELNKSRSKKLSKEWELQRKLHAEWKIWVKEEGGGV